MGCVDISPGPEPRDAAADPGGGRAEDDAGPTDDGERGGDGPGGDGPGGTEVPVGEDPLRFHHWMKRSAAGAVLSGIALGLQQALEPKRELPAFVMEAPGEPDDPDAPIHLHFDPDDPTKTVAVIRPTAPSSDGPTSADPGD